MVDIIHRIGIKAPANEVYKALSTVEGVAGWWTSETTGESRVGGAMTVRFIDHGSDAEKGRMEFDVTALARSWADSPATNYGVVFTTDIPASNNEVWDYPVFHSKESTAGDALKPRLELSLAAQTM